MFRLFGIAATCVFTSMASVVTISTSSTELLLPISVVISSIIVTATAVWFLSGQCALIKDNARQITELKISDNQTRAFEKTVIRDMAKIKIKLRIE